MKADGGCEYVRSGIVCDFATSETLVSFILVRLREVPSSRRGEDFCPKLNIVLTSLGPTPHTLLLNLKRKYIYIYIARRKTLACLRDMAVRQKENLSGHSELD